MRRIHRHIRRAIPTKWDEVSDKPIAFSLPPNGSHLYPPKRGNRKAEFSSAIPGRWSPINGAKAVD